MSGGGRWISEYTGTILHLSATRLSRGLCVNVRSCVVLTYAARARLPSPLQHYLPLSFEPRLDMETRDCMQATACITPQHALLHTFST